MKKFMQLGLVLLFCFSGGIAPAQDDLPARDDMGDKALIDDVDRAFGVTVMQSDKWIGVLCRPVDEVLRQHLNLPENTGLVVEQVVPHSPADTAGIRARDILTQLDGEPLDSLDQLVAKTAGADESGFRVSWIRDGKAQLDATTVHPEKRPEGVGTFRADRSLTGEDLDTGKLRAWVDKLQGGQPSADERLQFRFFGPGVTVPPLGKRSAMRINIEIRRENDEPAKIKVTKDDTTWEITEDQLDQLPEDVRGAVRNALGQGGGQGMILIQPGEAPWPGMNERLDEMHRQMKKMFEELQHLRRDQPDEEDDSIDA